MDTLGHGLLRLRVEVWEGVGDSHLRIPMSFPCQFCAECRDGPAHMCVGSDMEGS